MLASITLEPFNVACPTCNSEVGKVCTEPVDTPVGIYHRKLFRAHPARDEEAAQWNLFGDQGWKCNER